MIALIADIHGNLPGLEAVLKDVEEVGAERVVCLGDVANFGPQPREALASVAALGCPVVMGNTDAALLEPRGREEVTGEDAQLIFDVEAWCAERMEEGDRAFVRTFEPTLRLEEGGSLLCFHGSPASFDDVIVAATPDEVLDDLFAGEHAQVMAGGHTHTQLLRRYREGFIVNPGSVGLPFAYFEGAAGAVHPHWAEYALLDVVQGQPSFIFRRVPYDVAPLVNAAQDGMPHAEAWLAGWLEARPS